MSNQTHVEVSPNVRRSAKCQTRVEVSPNVRKQSNGREIGGFVEVSPNVRKSAELGAMNQTHVEVSPNVLCVTLTSPLPRTSPGN